MNLSAFSSARFPLYEMNSARRFRWWVRSLSNNSKVASFGVRRTRDLHLRPHLCCFWTDWDKYYTEMSALERTFEWRRVIGPRTLAPSVIFGYAVTYDLRDLWLTHVIHDVIGDDSEVSGRKIVFHSKFLAKTVMLVYYLSQSVQKQQRCVALKIGRVSVWRQKLATLLVTPAPQPGIIV